MTEKYEQGDAGVVAGIADAFVYGYASVDLYRILHNFALDPTSLEFKAHIGQFHHSRQLPDPLDRTIVAMNVDAPYSYAWLDLRAEPTVLTVPATQPDRYVSAMLVDLYTYIVGYVSPRTNHHRGGQFLLVGPQWDGVVPDGIDEVFRCPTDLMLVFVRTQLLDADDLPGMAATQDGFAAEPLSVWSGSPAPAAPPPIEPIEPIDVRVGVDPRFFDVMRWMQAFMPTLPEDADLRETFGALADSDAAAISAGMTEGLARMAARARTVQSSGEIFGSREHFGGDHLSRAVGAMLGILGNAEEEYLGVGYHGDATGARFDGRQRYTITFGPDGLPPVDAFWSITVYDADSFLYANALERYTLGSRGLPGMRRSDDGSITLHLSTDSPGADLEANWLPVPPTPFTLAFRTYLPREEIRDGRWTAPPVIPVP